MCSMYNIGRGGWTWDWIGRGNSRFWHLQFATNVWLRILHGGDLYRLAFSVALYVYDPGFRPDQSGYALIEYDTKTSSRNFALVVYLLISRLLILQSQLRILVLSIFSPPKSIENIPRDSVKPHLHHVRTEADNQGLCYTFEDMVKQTVKQ
jgi:hypothetical protein